MKVCCNVILLLFSLLFISKTANCAGLRSEVQHRNAPRFTKVVMQLPGSSMQKKEPRSEATIILIRLGIEGKSKILPYHTNAMQGAYVISCLLPAHPSTNQGRIKYLFEYTLTRIQPREFFSSYSFHAPPSLA